MRLRKEMKADPSPLRLLLWTAIAGLIFGLIGFGELPEDLLRIGRNSLHQHRASGDIVLVTIDNNSLRSVGRWPWPRRNHAEIVRKLSSSGAKRIFFDIVFDARTDKVDDESLAQAIQQSGRVVLPVRGKAGPNGLEEADAQPIPMLSHVAELASITVNYNYQNAVWQLPYAVSHKDKLIPSFAAALANRRDLSTSWFPADYSLVPTSIPTIGAEKVLQGDFDPRLVRGKDVVIGTNAEATGDLYFIPGVGKMGGAYVHIIGAETLKSGKPISLGWAPAFLLSLAISAFAALRLQGPRQQLTFGMAAVAFLVVPLLLEMHVIFVDIMPALFVTTIVGSVLTWRGYRKRGLVNAISGLPNLSALRDDRAGRDCSIVACRIMNYAEIVAALPGESERQLIDQIVSRLSVGSPRRTFYQGDGGIFAWFEDSRAPFANHLDALSTLFRNPIRVSGMPIDLTVSFGVEIGSARSVANRLASALLAAQEAAHDGLRWKYHNPESFENASWKLSLLSQLDLAIDKGEVWIAFQPKLEVKTRRIVGAEALARWTHPEKGPIAASEFVAAAEQSDRIGKLTDFVLEKAVAAAASINKRGYDFDVAVNLSARLLTDRQFTIRVAALLARHGLPPHRLMLELTETAELASCGESLDMLSRLRDLGIGISIDDYGTGLSTLDYLKKIPATEIKIDQSFVKGLCDNRSDRLMVQSTIGLAHSLGRKVVAEGVEQYETLEALVDMDCDLAQGFVLGRPMSFESLMKRLAGERRRTA